MGDFEEAEFCAELWRLHQEREVKKECLGKKREQKKSRNVQADESSRKRKNCRFKEAMMERKGKKKERRKEKKKKRKKKLEREAHQTSASSNLQQKEKLNSEYLIPDFPEKSRRIKKVQFDSFPPYIRVKRPTFSSSSSKEAEAVRSTQSCPQVTGLSQVQVQDNVSQCPSEDINSQDLFITQKSFRTPPRELSSSESSDRAVTASHLSLMQPHSESNNHHGEDQKEFRPREVHSYLDEPLVMTSHTALAQCCSLTASSTQTENFFTSELSSFLSFCQRSRAGEDSLKPLDLSLPQRARTALCLTTKASGISSKDDLPSPPFQPDPTFSSEEDHPSGSDRREMIQVRAVQMKLNKPFFFKTKGERPSPRPESPLMKLSQGRAVKSQRRR